MKYSIAELRALFPAALYPIEADLLDLLEEARELVSQQFVWSDGYDDKARALLDKLKKETE